MARGGLGSCAIQISKNMTVHDDPSYTHDYHQLRKVGGTRDMGYCSSLILPLLDNFIGWPKSTTTVS